MEENKLFDIVIIGNGIKGNRLATKLSKEYSVALIGHNMHTIGDTTLVEREAIYVAYVRGILGVTLSGNSQPTIFGRKLIIATSRINFLPANFFKKNEKDQIIINEDGQLPAVKPLVYVANKVATGFNSKVEANIINTIKEGLKKKC